MVSLTDLTRSINSGHDLDLILRSQGRGKCKTASCIFLSRVFSFASRSILLCTTKGISHFAITRPPESKSSHVVVVSGGRGDTKWNQRGPGID